MSDRIVHLAKMRSPPAIAALAMYEYVRLSFRLPSTDARSAFKYTHDTIWIPIFVININAND
jgi:hypothetical protein